MPVSAALALVPVLAFLAVLILLDSFKLVPLRSVLLSLLAGCAAALACSQVNLALLGALPLDMTRFSRYVAPLTEELLKAAFVVYLVQARRVGFLVDAAIHGFAVGAGFALVENVEYLRALGSERVFLWVVRGFGTAVLHGATTAIFAILAKGLAERHPERGMVVFLPGLLAAALVHSAFNHFILPPLLATALMMVVLPVLMVLVFEQSEKATREWLGLGFDSEMELLRMIASGEVARTRIGAYLQSLRSKFEGTIVADMLCLLRIHLELSIRAKGLLLAREAGLEVPVGDDVRDNLNELRYLEKSIGPTGLLALKPVQRRTHRDLWQIYMLEREEAARAS